MLYSVRLPPHFFSEYSLKSCVTIGNQWDGTRVLAVIEIRSELGMVRLNQLFVNDRRLSDHGPPCHDHS